MYQHKALNTNAKLKSIEVADEDTCFICSRVEENLYHLFFSCDYSRKVIGEIENWIRVPLPRQGLSDWRTRGTGTKLKQGIVNVILNATIYNIWRQRNLSKFELKLNRPEKVAQNIKTEMRARISGVIKGVIDDCDRGWLRQMQIEI
ncbi:uncharacterized protein LOC141648878 [Silene latifolia]|uniref:uncharacterized protein LOC141648878 n=1 Tax=Silene latifolia TaxID=37657 RepID=UPI003D76CC2B